MRKSLRLLPFLSTTLLLSFACSRLDAQSAPPQAQQPSAQQHPQPQSPKTVPVGPAAPQSTHYPILLLAFGNDPTTWSVRIGQKGPERLDRPHYPPINLEPADVTHEAAPDSWTYHAKDTATGAALAVHLTREACSGPVPTATGTSTAATPPAPASDIPAKFTFRVSVEHEQIGLLNGCARVAADLFPRINNQAVDEDDATKPRPPVSTVTNFKAPIAIAYLNSSKQLVLKRGSVVRTVAPDGSQPSLSRDGKRLLYTREEKNVDRTISLYDSATGKSSELLRGQVQQAFWSPDDTLIAFMKSDGSKWRLWSMPANAPDRTAQIYSGEVASLHGWTDANTILADDRVTLLWISDGGGVKQTISTKELYGDSFRASSSGIVRVHPLNPDLLLVSAEAVKPPAGTPSDSQRNAGFGFFLYEVRAKRRVVLSPSNMLSEHAEWSRDGLQIFFTGTDASRHSATYRIFWDGTGLRRYTDGASLVVGQ